MQNKKIQDVSGLLKKIPKCKKELSMIWYIISDTAIDIRADPQGVYFH